MGWLALVPPTSHVGPCSKEVGGGETRTATHAHNHMTSGTAPLEIAYNEETSSLARNCFQELHRFQVSSVVPPGLACPPTIRFGVPAGDPDLLLDNQRWRSSCKLIFMRILVLALSVNCNLRRSALKALARNCAETMCMRSSS